MEAVRGWVWIFSGIAHCYIPNGSHISHKSHIREALRWSLHRFVLFQEEGLTYYRCEIKAVYSSGLF